MKPIEKRIAILGLSALLISGAGSALAFGGGHKGGHGCDRGHGSSPMAVLNQLEDLTDEQKQQLREIRSAAKETMRDLRDEMHDNRDDLHDAMADNADLDTIRSLAKHQGDQVARMIILRAEIREKVNNVLTEAQQKELGKLRPPRMGFAEPRKRMPF